MVLSLIINNFCNLITLNLQSFKADGKYILRLVTTKLLLHFD